MHMEKKYEIIQNLTWNCRISEIVDKGSFLILKIVRNETNEFLCSITRSSEYFDRSLLEGDQYKRIVSTIQRVAIKTKVPVYHKLTWDDVERGLCPKSSVGEVQRSDNGTPILYVEGSIIILFEDFDDSKENLVGNQFMQNYIEPKDPRSQTLLNFTNPYKRRNTSYYDESCCPSDDAYEAAQRRQWDLMDMSEEDRIMDALENGMGELYGF